jgi:hypothetical protein
MKQIEECGPRIDGKVYRIVESYENQVLINRSIYRYLQFVAKMEVLTASSVGRKERIW